MSKGKYMNQNQNNQNPNAGGGYTSPYGGGGGGFGGGTYDPMLGFGQASGMGTTYNYPARYSADYTRYAQSGQPFNQPVMGYNTYGQIFAQPQRPQPPPIMGGGKGGGGFQPGYGYQPQFPGMMAGGPGFPQQFPRRPERRSNQLGLNQPPASETNIGNFLDFYKRQNNPANSIFEPGSQPPTIGGKGGGGQTDNITIRKPSVGFDPEGRSRNRQNNLPEYVYPTNEVGRLGGPGPTPPRVNLGGTSPGSFFDRMQQGQRLDENIYNSPFGQLLAQPAVQPAMQQQGPIISNPDRDRVQEIMMRSYNNPSSITSEDRAFLQEYDARPRDAERQLADQRQMTAGNTFGLGGMPIGRPQTDPNLRVMGERNFDMQGFDMPSQPFNFGQDFGRMYFQEGGQVPPDANMEMMLSEAGPANPQSEMAGEYDRLIQMTMQAVLGQTENADEIIQMFIDEFGVDAFRQLRDAVLKQQVPNAQTEGMVDGNGGGMDDQVMGMIGNQRPVAVSPGEYIVPADVVSGLGDGSSKSGADILDELNQAVRMARTGTTEQPRPLAESMR